MKTQNTINAIKYTKHTAQFADKKRLPAYMIFGIIFSIAPLLLADAALAAPINTTASAIDGAGSTWPCALGTWCNNIPTSPVGLYVNLTCTGTCGITYYCQDATDTCTPNINYKMSGPFQSGTAYVRYFSVNASGGNEPVKSGKVMIDTEPPITSASATANSAAYIFNTAASSSVAVTLSCSDVISGCGAITYCADASNTCTPATAYSTTLAISTAGTSYIRYNSTDIAGNKEAVKSRTIQIGTAPVTIATAVKSDGTNYTFSTWTNSSGINVTLAVPVGGTILYCSSTAGPCTPNAVYSAPVKISPFSIPTYISYRSSDATGLNEAAKTQIVNFDAGAPTTFAGAVNSTNGTYVFGNWANSAYVNVTIGCTDSGTPNSGCNTTLYCTDTANNCAPNTTYSAPVQISTSGTSYIRYKSNDTAGNIGATSSQKIMLGGVIPPITAAAAVKNDSSSYSFGTWTNSAYINVTLVCFDTSGPGCGTTSYCTSTANNCTPNLVYSAPVQISTSTVSYIRFSSNDTAGTQEAANNQTVMIDTVAPATTATATSNGTAYAFGNTATQSVNVSLSCADTLSGCASTYYCVDASNACSPSAGGLTYPASGISVPATGFVRYQSLDTAGVLETVKSGAIIIGSASISTPIYAGWNLIGWTSATPTNATAFGTLVGANNVAAYSALTQQWVNRALLPGIGWIGTEFEITQGNAVFVYSTVNSTWIH